MRLSLYRDFSERNHILKTKVRCHIVWLSEQNFIDCTNYCPKHKHSISFWVITGSQIKWMGRKTQLLGMLLVSVSWVISGVRVRGNLVVSVLDYQSWGSGFKSRSGRNLDRDFCSICTPSELSYGEYTDRTLSVGRWDSEGGDWPPALICRG